MPKFSSPRVALIAPAIFLFILPITHTTALRHLCMLLSVIAVLLTWKRHAPLVLSTEASGRFPHLFPRLAIAFWFGVCLLTTALSSEFDYSQGEFRNEVVYTLLAFSIFYCFTDSAAAWKLWRKLLLASFFVISILCLFSSYYYSDFVRESLVGDRNAYSTYVVLIFPFLLFLATDSAQDLGFSKLWIYVALVLAIVTGALSLNRNMWLGLAAQSILFSGLWLIRQRQLGQQADSGKRLPLKRLALLLALGLVVMASIFVIVNRQKIEMLAESGQTVQTGPVNDPRIEIWGYALQHIKDKPVLGHGYGRGILRKDFRTHFDDPLKWHGHNIVLNYGMEAGVFGMAAIILLFTALTYQCWKIYRSANPAVWPFGVWGLTILIGIVIKMLTDDILVRDNALLFWSMLGMIWGYALRQLQREGDPITAARLANNSGVHS